MEGEKVEKYKVRATASALGCTPDLIYSYFKDRHDPVDGGLTKRQVYAIADHVESKRRKRPFKNKYDDVAAVLLLLNNRPNSQMQIPTV